MYLPSDYQVFLLMEVREQEGICNAEKIRWLREATPTHHRWLPRQIGRLFPKAGHFLITLGNRLVEYRAVSWKEDERKKMRIFVDFSADGKV